MAIFYFFLFLGIASMAIYWFMQVVHYPLLPYVDASKWAEYSEKRKMFSTMILYPLMAFEVLTGFTVLILATQSKTYPLLALSLVLLVCLVVYSLVYLNPHFKKITGPTDEANIQKFIKLHWVRTLGWTFRFLLMLMILLGSA